MRGIEGFSQGHQPSLGQSLCSGESPLFPLCTCHLHSIHHFSIPDVLNTPSKWNSWEKQQPHCKIKSCVEVFSWVIGVISAEAKISKRKYTGTSGELKDLKPPEPQLEWNMCWFKIMLDPTGKRFLFHLEIFFKLGRLSQSYSLPLMDK